MKNYQELYQLLLRSFDETLTKEEQQALDVGLKQDERLQAAYDELTGLNGLFETVEYGYAPKFEDDVFKKLKFSHKKQNRSWLPNLAALFPKVAYSSFAIIGLLLFSVYFTHGSIDIDTILGISDLSEETISSLEYSEH